LPRENSSDVNVSGAKQRRTAARSANAPNDPVANATLPGIGPGAAAPQVQPVGGTGAKISGGILTFIDAKGATSTFHVDRISQGAPNPAAPAQGAYLYTASDSKSGILFTVMGTDNGAVSGMPLNEQALKMLKGSQSPNR
jgi:hypothetical protein